MMKCLGRESRSFYRILLFGLLSVLLINSSPLVSVNAAPLAAQYRGYQKISTQQGKLGDVLRNGDRFGSAVIGVGDLDGDGIGDLAVGAPNDMDSGAADRQGAVWILFLQRDGTVKAKQKISATAGGLSVGAGPYHYFGFALANLGDLDGDQAPEIAVGAPFANDGGLGKGAVWVLFLNRNGTVKRQQTISATAGGLGAVLADEDFFGSSLANLGDLDRDGVVDLAVGAPGSDDGGADGNRGALWLLSLKNDGTVKATRKISATAGGFGGQLEEFDQLGQSVTNVGDVNNDGVTDLAAGVLRLQGRLERLEIEEGNGQAGAQGVVWLIFLQNDGTVKAQQEIGVLSGRFGPGPSVGARYGSALASLGDLNNDGIPDLVVGAHGQKEDGKQKNRGAAWLLNLQRDGLVKNAKPLAVKVDKLQQALKSDDQYSWAIANVGDLNGDGTVDLAIGAPGDDDGGAERGAVWIVLLKK